MYQFSEQLNNTVSPVVRPSLQSRFTNSVKRAAPPASAIGTHATFRSDPYVGHGNFSNVPAIGHDHDSAELLPRLEAFRSCNVRKVDKRPLQKFRISRTLPGQIRRARVCKHSFRIHSATETFLLDYFTRSQLAFLLRHNASLISCTTRWRRLCFTASARFSNSICCCRSSTVCLPIMWCPSRACPRPIRSCATPFTNGAWCGELFIGSYSPALCSA